VYISRIRVAICLLVRMEPTFSLLSKVVDRSAGLLGRSTVVPRLGRVPCLDLDVGVRLTDADGL